MDMANQGFLGSPELTRKPLTDYLAEASMREAWRLAATREMMADLSAEYRPKNQAAIIHEPFAQGTTSIFESFAAASRTESEMLLQAPGRKKAGERRRQILCGFVEMLENHKEERITTSGLAKHLELSEAALYRHFDSKSQMLESLILFIENSIFQQVAQINLHLARRARTGGAHASLLVATLLAFAEQNPGISRVMAGDALVMEDESLRQRMNMFFVRFEELLGEALRGVDACAPERGSEAASEPDEAALVASSLCAFCIGRLLRFARTGFRSMPSAQLDDCLAMMLG